LQTGKTVPFSDTISW